MTEVHLQAKRPRTVHHPELETALANWVLQMEHRKLCLSQSIIQEKARNLAKQMGLPEDALKFSSGWLYGFCSRNNFKSYTSHGESGSVNLDLLNEALPGIQDVCHGPYQHRVISFF